MNDHIGDNDTWTYLKDYYEGAIEVNIEKAQEELPLGEQAAIILGGNNVMRGYNVNEKNIVWFKG